MITKSKILIDLSVAYDNNSGIPLDTKWLYKQLANNSNYDVFGLIYCLDWRNYKFNIDKNESETDRILKYSQYLTYFEPIDEKDKKTNILNRLRKRIDITKYTYLKRNFSLWVKQTELFNDVIFRLFFEKGMNAKDRELIEKGKYVFTDFFKHSVFSRIMRGNRVKLPYLNTTGFDYIIHQDSVPVEVSKETQKIIRYHDPIPVLSPDLTQNSYQSATYHYLAIQKCINQGAIYVCNSLPVEEELQNMFPRLKGRTTTIPYTISDVYKPSYDSNRLFEILSSKFSNVFSEYEQTLRKMIDDGKNNPKDFKYIAEIATIEPRKNYVKLIKAFNIAKYNLQKKNINLKLIIAGGLGWKYESIIKQLKPLVKNGEAILLDNLHPDEIKYIYSHAQAFLFPTLKEGFGLPPVEAMLCKTPVISSDIKVHRWVQGDSSFYVDPYDSEDIAQKIEYVVLNRDTVEIKERIEKGEQRAKKYDYETNKVKWENLFNEIKSGKYRR